MNEPKIETVAIIGTGLMGGSLGMAILERRLARTVRGYDRDRACLETALKSRAITETSFGPEQAAAGADLVVLATPVGVIGPIFEGLRTALKEGAYATDLGSTKARIVTGVGLGAPFVGGHPMTGSERSGIAAARPDLYTGCLWILTPVDGTSRACAKKFTQLLTDLHVRWVMMDPQAHDATMAKVSHLPQLISSALAAYVGDGSRSSIPAGPALSDMTRIAASDPAIWIDILRDNPGPVLDAVDGYRRVLDELRNFIAGENWEGLSQFLEHARDVTASIPTKPGVDPLDLFEVRVRVLDRPGFVAEVTAAVTAAGLNIEGLRIEHVADQGRGILYLYLKGAAAAEGAVAVIRTSGFKAHLG